jgi:quercetin dioxygenase-like cupin family protein
MKSKRIWAALVTVLAAGGGVLASSVLATTQTGVTTSTVATAPLPPIRIDSFAKAPAGSPFFDFWRTEIKTHGISDLYVVDNKFAPGGTTGWHTHPGPSLIIVVTGTITNYRAANHRCGGVNYPAGTAFIDAGGNDIHMLKNNGTATAETVAVQFIPHGQPRRIEEPQPPNCPS